MKKLTVQQKNARQDKWIFGTLLLFSLLGLIVAFVLSYEKLELLKEPDKILSCSINAALNCASVMKTWQATVFGFPNSWIGLAAFPVMMCVAFGGLLGVKYTKAFFNVFVGGLAVALIFAHWLFFQSVYVIDVLCPWCLVVTFSTTILFWTGLQYSLRENTFNLTDAYNKKAQSFLKKDGTKVAAMLWEAALLIIIIQHFGARLTATGL